MKKSISYLILILCFFVMGTNLFAQSTSFFTINSDILIKENTREDLISWAESLGGYFTINSSSLLQLKIPIEQVSEIKAALERYSQRVFVYDISSNNVEQEINEILVSIQSREEILEENLRFVQSANVDGTLALEKEVTDIINEMENLRGRLRVLENQRNFALINLSLIAPEPQIPESTRTSFPWLQQINFYHFISKEFK